MNFTLEIDQRQHFKIDYGNELKEAIERLSSIIKKETSYPNERIIAIQYLSKINEELGAELINLLEPIKQT